MRVFQNVAIGVAVILVAMACMVFGDWLARGKRQPDYYYCPNASTPDRSEDAASQQGAAPNQKEARETANQRKHELCQQWRSAQAAEEATRVAWIQLWFGLAGLAGIGLTVYFAAQSARAAADAAGQMARQIDVQMSVDKPLLVVTDITVDGTPSRLHWIDFKIKNIGKTPAILLRDAASAEIRSEEAKIPTYRSAFADRGRVLGENDVVERSILTRNLMAIRVSLTAYRVYFWGYVTYQDPFGRKVTTGFGYLGQGLSGIPKGGKIELKWYRMPNDAYNYTRVESD